MIYFLITSSTFVNTFLFLSIISACNSGSRNVALFDVTKYSQLLSLDFILPALPPLIKALVEWLFPLSFITSESFPPYLLEILVGVAPLDLISFSLGESTLSFFFGRSFFNLCSSDFFTEDESPMLFLFLILILIRTSLYTTTYFYN